MRENEAAGTADPILAALWHWKLAVPLACAAMGPLAVALVAARRRLVPTMASTAGALVVFAVLQPLGWAMATEGPSVPAGAWAPAGWIVLLAVVGLARTRDEALAGP